MWSLIQYFKVLKERLQKQFLRALPIQVQLFLVSGLLNCFSLFSENDWIIPFSNHSLSSGAMIYIRLNQHIRPHRSQSNLQIWKTCQMGIDTTWLLGQNQTTSPPWLDRNSVKCKCTNGAKSIFLKFQQMPVPAERCLFTVAIPGRAKEKKPRSPAVVKKKDWPVFSVIGHSLLEERFLVMHRYI